METESLALGHLRNVDMLYVGVKETGSGIVRYSLGTKGAGPIVQQGNTPIDNGNGDISQLAVGADGTKLYAGGSNSGLTTFDISSSGSLSPTSIQQQDKGNPGTPLFQRFSYTPDAIYSRPASVSQAPAPLMVWSLQHGIPESAGPWYACTTPPPALCLLPRFPIVDATAAGSVLTAAQYYQPIDAVITPAAGSPPVSGIVGTRTQVYTLGSIGELAPPAANTVITPGQLPLMTTSSADGIPVVLTTSYAAYKLFAPINLASQYSIFVSLLNVPDGQSCPTYFRVTMPGDASFLVKPLVGKKTGSTCPSTVWHSLDTTGPPTTTGPLVGAQGQVMFSVGVDGTGAATPASATYQIKIGTGPADEIQTLATLTDTVSGTPVLILVPGYAYTGDAQAAIETLTGYAQRYSTWATAAAVPTLLRPKLFTVSASSLYLRENSSTLSSELIVALASLGFNTVGFNTVGLSTAGSSSSSNFVANTDSALTSAGIPYRSLRVSAPPVGGAQSQNPPVCSLQAYVKLYYDCENSGGACQPELMTALGQSGYVSPTGVDNVREVGFWDEPGWYYPDIWGNSDRTYLLGDYQPYMEKVKLPRGYKPFSSNVTPIGRGGAPDDTSSKETRAQFYWTTRFFDFEAAKVAQIYSSAIQGMYHNAFAYVDLGLMQNGTPGQTYAQWTCPDGHNPISLDDAEQTMGWFQSGGTNAYGLWTEQWDWDYNAENSSFVGAVLRSAGMPRGTSTSTTQSKGFGNYTVASQTGYHPEGASYKILSLVGQGAKLIDVYSFGPSVIAYTGYTPGAGIGSGGDLNSWSENQSAYRPIANAMRRLGGATEKILYPGQPARSKVALQLPGKSSLWFPVKSGDCSGKCPTGSNYELYSSESAGLHYALEHAGYSVEFVDDTDLATPGLLTTLGFQILYVTQLNISVKAQKQIADWVQAGGTVVATPGAGLWDEYNNLLSGGPGTLSNALGLSVPAVTTPGPWTQLRENPDALLRASYSNSDVKGWNDPGGASNMTETYASNVKQVSGPYLFPPGFVRLFAAPLSPLTSTDVVAQFTGPLVGSLSAPVPAVTVHKFGKGTAIAYGFFPGTEYLLSQERLAPDRLPSHWDADARTRAVTPVVQAPVPVTRQVYADVPLVEALRLDSPQGTGVVLLNWNDWQVGDSPLAVNVFIAGAGGKTVTSVEGNPLTTQTVGADLKVKMTMKNVDILTVK